MTVRKISASYIFAGSSGFLKNGILTLTPDGHVLGVTDTGGNLAEQEKLEHYNGILCPGFVNAHCHTELSHMAGKIPRNTELTGFIESVIQGRKADKEIIFKAIEDADRSMRREGIVAVGDICNTADSFEIKSQSPVYYHSFIEIFGTSPENAHDTYRNGVNLVQQARQKFAIPASITPHSSYSLSEKLFSLIREGIPADDTMLSVHNQETSLENDLVSGASGKLFETFRKLGFNMSSMVPQHKNSLPWLLEQLPRNIRILLVHNVYTTENDIIESNAEKSDIYWVLCPKSNFYIGGVYPGAYLINCFPDRVCIGTDSLASNDKLSILEELYTLQNIHPEIPLQKLLSFASINGAKALGIDKWCGSFEEGKKPGIILIENVDIQNLKLKENSRARVL